jgi:hypothetical protein
LGRPLTSARISCAAISDAGARSHWRRRLRAPALFFQHLGDALVGHRLQEAERQVLQLPLQLPDAQPVGQRRIEVEGLARILCAGFVLLLGLGEVAQRGHARGQPHQHRAHVGGHGQQHLAQGFDLGRGLLGGILAAQDLVLGLEAQAAKAHQLAHIAHQLGNFLAEAFFELFFQLGMEHLGLEGQPGDAGGGIDIERSEHGGHRDRELQRILPGQDLPVGIQRFEFGHGLLDPCDIVRTKSGGNGRQAFAVCLLPKP